MSCLGFPWDERVWFGNIMKVSTFNGKKTETQKTLPEEEKTELVAVFLIAICSHFEMKYFYPRCSLSIIPSASENANGYLSISVALSLQFSGAGGVARPHFPHERGDFLILLGAFVDPVAVARAWWNIGIGPRARHGVVTAPFIELLRYLRSVQNLPRGLAPAKLREVRHGFPER